MVGLCSQMSCVSPAFPLQLSLPTPPTWNGSPSTSSWHLLIHLKITIPSLPWSPIWSIFPDEVLFPFLHRQFGLVTDECTLCPQWHAWLPELQVIRRLTACLPLDRSGWPSPDGSLPAVRMNFHIWSCSFQKWKAWLSHPCRPSSNAQKPGLAWAINPDSQENATHSRACRLCLALDYAIVAEGWPSLKPNQSYSRSSEQLHVSLPPRCWSQCHCSWKVLPIFYRLTHFPSSLQAPIPVLCLL